MIHILFAHRRKKQTSNFQSPNTLTPHLPSSSLWTFLDRLSLGWASLLETKEAEFVCVVGSCKPADSFGGVLECDLRIGSLITEQFDF